MPYDYIEEYQKQDDETIWEFRDKDAQSKIDTSLIETDYANPLSLETMQAQLAKNTKIKIEPIQDLHGYDKPWVGGAGKNILPMTIEGIKAVNTSGTWSGNAYTVNGVTFTVQTDNDNNIIGINVNGTTTSSTSGSFLSFPMSNLHTYDGQDLKLNGFTERNDNLRLWIGTDGYGTVTSTTLEDKQFTMVNTATRAWLQVTTGSVTNVNVKPMLRLSTVTDASFEPYTNITSISGHDQIDILGCGKNLFNPVSATSTDFAYTNGIFSNSQTDTKDYFSFAIQLRKDNNAVYNSGFVQVSTTGRYNLIYNFNDNYDTIRIRHNGTIRDLKIDYLYSEKGKHILSLYVDGANPATVGGLKISNIQLEKVESSVSIPSDYSPYQASNDLSIDLPSTVYGGVLDLESGELVAGWKYKVFTGTEQWRVANSMFYTEIIDSKYSGKGSLIGYDCYCSHYKSAGDKTWNHFTNGDINIGSDTNGSDRPYVNIKDTRYTDVESFKTAINGVQLVYELSTPFTLYISPERLKLLKAQNNLTTSQYTQIKVTYRNGVFATLEELSDATQDIYDEISGDATTVSGNPINFTIREKQKSKSTIIDLNPIQDLHGYSKPWVGGAGKNLLPLDVATIKSLNTDGTWSGNKYTLSNVEFTILVDSDNNVIGIKMNTLSTPASNVDLKLFGDFSTTTTYTSAGSYTISLGGDGPNLYAGYQSATLLQTNGTPTATCSNGLSWSVLRAPLNKSLSNVTIYPMIRLSSVTDSTFEPYTNIASISGRSSVDIDGCGKNLYIGSPSFDGYDNRNNWTKDTATYNGHEIIYRQSAWQGVQKGILLSAGTYIFSSSAKASESCNCQLVVGDGVGAIFAFRQMNVSTSWGKYSIPFTLTGQQIVYAKMESMENKTLYISEYQIERNDHATSYESYTPSTDLTISFSTTVYGGRLDVENGILVMDRKYKLYDGSSDEEWAYSSGWSKTNTNVFFSDIVIEDAYFPFYDVVSITNCNYFEGFSRNRLYEIDTNGVSLSGSTSQGKITIRILKSTASSLEDFKTWIASNNIEIVYILNTPTTLQLTPQQVQLLKGINNISTTGTTITVTFKNGSVAHLDDLPENAFTDLDKEKLASIDTLLNALGLSVVDGKLCQTYNT